MGLGHSLLAHIPITGERLPLHDRGKVLVQAMLMLVAVARRARTSSTARPGAAVRVGAVGLDAVPDAASRRRGDAGGLWEAVAEVRAQVWGRSAATTGDAPVVLDIDSSLVEVHSENKEGRAVR